MQTGESKRVFLKKLLRYFGFPLAAAALMLLVFFFAQRGVLREIRKDTYQMLQDATRQQCISLEQYVGQLTTRVTLIADYDGDTGPNTLVESLRTELRDSAADVETGYANPAGELLYSDQTEKYVGAEDWFSRSLRGETIVMAASQNEDDGLADVRISVRVATKSGVRGVLFATVGNKNFAALLQTLAYEGGAVSLVCDSEGNILFAEQKESIVQPGTSIYDIISDRTLTKEYSLLQLQDALGSNSVIQFRFRYEGTYYYAVCEAMDVCDWYTVSIVSADLADTTVRKVSLYQVVMISVILLVGVAMAARAYEHERKTVQTLEADKDLLRQSAQRYQLITQLSNEVFFHIILETGEISFNDSFEAMFGFPPPICTVHNLDQCTNMFFEPDRKQFMNLIEKLRAGEPKASAELRMVNARGAFRWKRVEVFSVFDKSMQAVQLVGKIADIHRQKQSLQHLIRQADSEPLTGLLNRAAFERNVKGFLSGEGFGGSHALLMLDFDNFKAVNDTLGHAKGDRLLISFAGGMQRLFRSGDYLTRIGGDEFMVFIKNTGEDAIALDKAEALREEMAGLSRKIGVAVYISVGIAIYNRDGETFEKLYQAADEALYHVKRTGKNAISFFSVPVDPALRNRLATQADDANELCDIGGMCADGDDYEI